MVCLLAGCGASAVGPDGFNDPHEVQNREVHEENVALDRAIIGPAARAYGRTVPRVVRRGVSNFAANLDLPGNVVNDLLQFQLGDAAENTLRFLVNSTLGVAGLFDPAKNLGLEAQDSDFGETLHVWGAKEGAYLVLPVLGPSTERDAIGTVVDFLLNPTRLLIDTPESGYAAAADIASALEQRDEFSNLVDDIFYESADGYAQARLLYLQNRRFELGDTSTDQYFDPYEDPYAQ